MAVISLLILAFIIAIVLVMIGSWFPLSPDGPAYRGWVFLRRITDPVLQPIRRVIPPIGGAIDISPAIVIIVLSTVRSLL